AGALFQGLSSSLQRPDPKRHFSQGWQPEVEELLQSEGSAPTPSWRSLRSAHSFPRQNEPMPERSPSTKLSGRGGLIVRRAAEVAARFSDWARALRSKPLWSAQLRSSD